MELGTLVRKLLLMPQVRDGSGVDSGTRGGNGERWTDTLKYESV